MKSFKKLFSLKHILFLGLSLRIALLLFLLAVNGDLSFVYHGDTDSYLHCAMKLLETGRFTDLFGEPEIARPPGYPLFLIPGLWLNNVEIVTILLQIGLSCITILLVYKISLLIFKKERAALLSSLLFAVEPLSILYTIKIMSETLLLFLLTYFIYLLLKFIRKPKINKLILSGLVLTCSIFVKPAAMYLPFLLIPLLLFELIRKRNGVIQSLIYTLMIVGIPFVSISAWTARNIHQANYAGFSMKSADVLYCYGAVPILADNEGIDVREMFDKVGCSRPVSLSKFRELHPEISTGGRSEIYTFLEEKGKEIILENPRNFLKFTIHRIRGLIKFAFFDPDSGAYAKTFKLYPKSKAGLMGDIQSNGLLYGIIKLYREKPLVFYISAILGLMLVFYNLTAALGIISAIFKPNFGSVLLLSLLIYFLIVQGVPYSQARYRLAFGTIICIFSGYGFSNLIERLAAKLRPMLSR